MSLLDGMTERNRRALVLLAAGLAVAAVLHFLLPDDSGSAGVAVVGVAGNASAESVEQKQQRLAKLRQIAASVPAHEAVLKQTAADLANRERGIIQADTAPQAQAALLEIARRIGKNNEIDVRGGEFGAPKAVGDYGLVYVTVNFECRIEQLVNFFADLSHEPELAAPSEEHITTGDQKKKTMTVRMVLAGVVPKKLVPEKKGLAAF